MSNTPIKLSHSAPNDVPLYESTPPSEDQKRLVTLFHDLEAKQIDFLDAAGKSVVERIASLLAVLFAITAFGNTFPPPYLKSNLPAKYLVLGTLLCYLSAMFLGMRTIQPRHYRLFPYNLRGMRAELDRMIENKSRWLRWAGWLFWIGSLMLALLIGTLVMSA